MSNATRLFQLYRGREDVFALAHKTADSNGELKVEYRPERRPLTVEDLTRHMAGDLVVGVYPMRQDSTCCFGAIDLDDPEHPETTLEKVRRLREAAIELGVPKDAIMMSFSGRKGHHLDVFFAEPIAAATVRLLLQAIVEKAGYLPGSFELFPKQDVLEVSKDGELGLGNLIKLPFARHPLTGRIAEVVDPGRIQPMSKTAVFEALLAAPEPKTKVESELSRRFADREDGFVVEDGERHFFLIWRGARLRNVGLDADDIFEILKSEGRKRCRTPVSSADDKHVREIADWFGKKEIGWALADDFDKARQQAQREETGPAAAVPLPVSSWPEPLAPEAFYGLAGEVVRAIEPHTEADPAAILLQFLTGYGNLIGRHPYFMAEDDHHFTNLFVILVGETSKARKGTSWGRARRLLGVADPDWASTRIMGGLSSGEGLIEQVRDAAYRTTKSGEVELVDPGVEDKRLQILETEFSSVLKQATREKNILAAVIRQAWETGYLRNLVVSAKRQSTDAHVSINGHITRDELLRTITETDAANGFGNRFLWACVRRSKVLPDGTGHPELGDLAGRICASVGFAQGVAEVRRDEEARAIWHRVYGPLSEGKPGLLGAMIARAEAQVMRVAVIYAMLDCSSVVTASHLKAALAVWQYCEDSARYIFGEKLGDPTADTILAALRTSEGGLTREQIRSDVFGRNKSAEEITRALRHLLDRRLVVSERVETGGRPAEVWRAA